MRLFFSLALLMIALSPNQVPKSQPMPNVVNATLSPEVKSLKDDIHKIEIRLQAFRSRQDWWNEWYLRLGLTTIVVATLLGGFSLFCQRKASNIELSSRPSTEELEGKNARLREVIDHDAQLEVAKAQKDAFDASTRSAHAEMQAGQANERAAKAQGSLALAEQHSAEANAKAEGFRLNIAKAEESAELAKAQVAGAMAEAAKANLELARFKTPRSLSEAQQHAIATYLSSFPNTPYDLWVNTDSDSTSLMELIDQTLKEAKWEFHSGGMIQFGGKAGVIGQSGITINFAAENEETLGKPSVELANALAAAGIKVKAVYRDNKEQNTDKDRKTVHVMIGSKPSD